MAYHITPSVGVDLDYNSTDLPYNDRDSGAPTPALGTKVVGSDGHDYVFVQASAAVTAETAVIITEPAFTVAAGAGAYSTQGDAVAQDAYCWVRANDI